MTPHWFWLSGLNTCLTPFIFLQIKWSFLKTNCTLHHLRTNIGVRSSLPWKSVSPSNCTTPYFLALWRSPTTCVILCYLSAVRSTSHVSRYFTVDAEDVFEENAGHLVLRVKVPRHQSVVPDDLTHVNDLKVRLDRLTRVVWCSDNLHTDVRVSSPSPSGCQSSFLSKQ